MLTKNQLDELSKIIEDQYGSAETLANWLDLAVEMLFYVEEDTFSRVELQEVATAIRRVVRVLRGIDRISP
ncbi:MAG: hypothetical protein DSY83_05495 [Flavobacteriia bacterium]|uniref:hypothetical protein n=1 Tax=Flagellimonas sp. TaxID=2058762 RepID=UPI001003641E|nr:MAG: hypothetical protein DSY83_05495 [Flavobacteriia bacterium]